MPQTPILTSSTVGFDARASRPVIAVFDVDQHLIARQMRREELIRVGWYREVRVKSDDSQAIRALLVARSRLVGIRRDLENQVRSLLKEVGLLFPRAIGGQFRVRVRQLVDHEHMLRPIVDSLLMVHERVEEQQAILDKRVTHSGEGRRDDSTADERARRRRRHRVSVPPHDR